MTFILLQFFVQAILSASLSPLCIGIIRKVKAKMQNREGASIFQPYRDIRKLFGKDEIIPHTASWIFSVTPFLLFSISLVIAGSIPLFYVGDFGMTGDFLTIAYLFALGAFFLALAGMDSGSPFGGFGSSREMMIGTFIEGGLLFSLLAPALLAQTSHLSGIVAALSHMPLLATPPLFLACGAFMIILLAENARIPVDNPATHLELTMVHEAMILEYSGKRLALIEWAAANKLFIFLSLAVSLFFPWGIAMSLAPGVLLPALLLFCGKVVLLCTVIAVIESVMAKLRIFRVPDLLLTACILGAIAVGIILA